MACHVGLLYDLKVLVLSRPSWRVLVTCLRAKSNKTSWVHSYSAKSNKTSWVHSVLRQTCSIVSVVVRLVIFLRNIAMHCFFQLHILLCSFLQLHSSCIPVANSSCKFYFHWGKHSQAQKLSKQILIRCQVSMIDELANASPNGNRICNWNLQLECNCRKLPRRICNWKNTRSGEETAYMSLCSWGQWLVMWAFCMTWRCWFCLVPHEEYLSLVCEQKATKQVEFIRTQQKATKQVEFIRLMAEILHHFWLDGISLHPLNLNIGGIQMQETDAVMNGWNPAPPSMSSQHWNYGGCRGKHQRRYNAIHGRRCRISAINSISSNLSLTFHRRYAPYPSSIAETLSICARVDQLPYYWG